PALPYQRFSMNDYAIPTFVGKRTLAHESSVGCPHRCNFCGVVDVFHSRWKAETPELTFEVVGHLKEKYRMDGLEFHDSDFFVSEKRVAELAEKLIDLNIKWWGEGRIDTLLDYSPDIWKLMERSGLKMIFFGAESGLDATLQLMDKGGVTREKTKAIAALCKQYNVQSEFSFVMGSNPTRTEEDIDATIRLMYELEEINPNSQMHPFIYTPVPFGNIYDKAVEGGLNYPKNLDEWATREWRQFTLRRNPHTPWLTKRLHKKIVNFRAVHESYFPRINDKTVPAWKLAMLKFVSAWRYKLRVYTGAYELRLLLRLIMNRPSGHEGF
ncbi:MAG: radical SAM protein, partial [Bacteroidota bacterium]